MLSTFIANAVARELLLKGHLKRRRHFHSTTTYYILTYVGTGSNLYVYIARESKPWLRILWEEVSPFYVAYWMTSGLPRLTRILLS